MTKTSPSPDIIYVIGQLNVGGTERHLSMMAQALTKFGWRVAVYSLAGDGPLRKDLEDAGITVLGPPLSITGDGLVFRVLRLMISSFYLAFVLAKLRPRIVHFFLPAAYLIGAVAAAIARIDIRIMSRRSLNEYQNAYPAMRWLETRLHDRMNAILGNSQAVIRQLRDDEGVAQDRLCLIYNGIEANSPMPRDRVEVRAALGLDANSLVFIIVANLIPYKGHLDLVAALSLASSELPDSWRLLVVGRDDGAGDQIRAAAQRFGLNGSLSFLGSRTDVTDLLAASDIGLLCSHQEGFSNAILEGMAAGLPMIVTNVGGNAEAVVDGKTGLVVSAHDPEALAAAITRLTNDRASREKFGAAGRARMQALFELDACAAKYDALYRALRAGKRPGEIPELQSVPASVL